jgi:hypothetical protein
VARSASDSSTAALRNGELHDSRRSENGDGEASRCRTRTAADAVCGNKVTVAVAILEIATGRD